MRSALPFSTRPAGEPPALRRHSKSSVTQAAISSASALLKALPKRRNRASMASAMVSSGLVRWSRSYLPGRRRELLNQEVDEGRDLGREMAAVRVDGVDR